MFQQRRPPPRQADAFPWTDYHWHETRSGSPPALPQGRHGHPRTGSRLLRLLLAGLAILVGAHLLFRRRRGGAGRSAIGTALFLVVAAVVFSRQPRRGPYNPNG
jgi:hypothetical protein